MKISINYKIQEGPWGGGNRFVKSLTDALINRGDAVTTTLRDRDIDLVLLIDPRLRNSSVTYSPAEIANYISFVNPDAIVVHRVNECDERKGTRFINGQLRRANYVADHTVFVGSWLMDLSVWADKNERNSSVIFNGADKKVFNSDGFIPWDGDQPLKIVTHHWGGNWLKGFDIYSRLDQLIATDEWGGKIHFTYVGNLPRNFSFKYSTHVNALDGLALAGELKRHHVYLTASINEPGGNHQNEGALCGLPLLYRESGCLPEYCNGFGVPFSWHNFEDSLKRMIVDYGKHLQSMAAYPHTADETCCKYLALFDSLTMNRELLAKSRRTGNRMIRFLAPRIPAIF